MSSYSCVTARLTMRSVLQTHGDSRARSGPVIGLLPRSPMAPMLPAMPPTHKVFICIHIYLPRGEPSVLNPRGVGRCLKRQKVRGRLLRPLSSIVSLGRLGTPEEIAKVVVF